ncbi:hypothetical protein J2Z40_001172 [Cytobacillus eiseniae]|uniref:Uncharacterized protein n=1 Tax=Cytobacillus eiseniae TaxID=762947 RepID=A0ABS4RE41_9BACI|nr:hypothetical protein [Cytobacillus eiseniae]
MKVNKGIEFRFYRHYFLFYHMFSLSVHIYPLDKMIEMLQLK